jgi:hypothetical protein
MAFHPSSLRPGDAEDGSVAGGVTSGGKQGSRLVNRRPQPGADAGVLETQGPRQAVRRYTGSSE